MSRRAIVAGHGDFAAGMISAVVQITGRDDVFAALSNRDRSTAGVEEDLRRLVEAHGASVIFTDLPAGSCTMAARRAQRHLPHIAVVVGANLGALLDFLFQNDNDPGAAAQHAVARGRESMSAVAPGGQSRGT